MTNTTSAQDLGQRIEQMITEHITASRACAQEAVVRAFATAASSSRPKGAPRPARPASGKKRPSAEIAALGERFYEVVCAKPGETMAVLRADVGASAREPSRSVALLRRAGRVRAVGSRHLTRYFPLSGS
ncbi:MAG: hypothetical protein KF718_26510 [Polyangiaceae bacterium]|nr:hypothetical protein [Polyangiaceae bacterium]